MTYSLAFHPDALKEWKKLNKSVKEQLKKVLARRLESPHVTSVRLRGNLKNCYKIKLLKAGYRLVYSVDDDSRMLTVVAVGRRADGLVYGMAENR